MAKHGLRVAAGLVALLLGAAACGGGSKPAANSGGGLSDVGGDANATGTLHVWLQVDAQTGWKPVVDSATQAFNAKYPKVNVQVDYQQWGDHLTKLDAALSGSQAPDVVEMGNTETTSYIANGAFADLSANKGVFDNSGTWNKGLQESCTYQGKLYCVPYYGGSRVVAYRKDMFSTAGISTPPASLDELMADGQKLMAKFGSDKNFSAFYMPGKFWYAALTFVNDAGGSIAKQGSDGKWVAQLSSPESIQGLTRWNDLVQKLYRGDKAIDEANPQQYTVMAQGHVAMMYGLGWEAGSVGAPKDKGGDPALADKIGVFPMPSATAGQAMQSFSGGSDLAITAKSQHQNWAAAWVKEFTNTKAQQGLVQAGNVPNTTSLLDSALSDPKLAPFAASAKSSWFVPVDPNWSKVEKSLVLQNTLAEIASGKVSVADGAKQMNDQVDKILNGA
jgi:N,N'-diacetylchitobiose transport system substrate-binding protein